MPEKETKKQDLSNNLKKLSEIANWFDKQKEVDIEEGLKRVKEAVTIIKQSKERLREIENEFEEIKKEIEPEGGIDSEEEDSTEEESRNEDEGEGGNITSEDVPF